MDIPHPLPAIIVPEEPETTPVQPPPPQAERTSLGTGIAVDSEISSTQAADVAWKAKFGTPTWPKPYTDVVNGLVSGLETPLREETATHVDMQSSIAAQQRLIETLKQQKSSGISPMDATAVMANLVYKNENPATVWEAQYGGQYVDQLNQAAARNPDAPTNDANAIDPVYVKRLQEQAGTLIAQREVASRVLEKAKKIAENQSWGGFLVDQAKYITPLYTDFKMRGLVEGTLLSGFGTSFLGSNLENQISKLSSISDINEYKVKLEGIVNQLSKDNPALAVAFSQAALGRPTSDVNLDNALNIVDLVTAAQVGGAGIKGIKNAILNSQVKGAIKDVAKSAAMDHEPPTTTMAVGTGDAAEAAVKSATETIIKTTTGEVNGADEALRQVTSALRYDGFLTTTNPSRNFRELATRLVNQYTKFEDQFKDVWNNANQVDRLAAFLRVEANVRKLQAGLKDEFPGLENNILDVSKPYKNEVKTGYNVDFHIGDKDGEHFKSENAATMFARMRGISKISTVEKEGDQFFLKVTKPLDETADVIRDGYMETDFARSPGVRKLLGTEKGGMANYIGSFIGKWRTSDEILSLAQRIERKNVAYATSNFQKLAKGEAKYIEALTKGAVNTDPITGDPIGRWSGKTRLSGLATRARFEDWNRAVSQARTFENPVTGKPGYYFKTPGELEDWYLNNIKRLPDDVEQEAYFAYKRLEDMDYMLTNLRVYNNKHRVGTMTHTLSAIDKEGNTVNSPKFDGVQQNFIPRTGDTIAWFKNHGMEADFRVGSDTGWLRTKEYKELEEDVKNGKYTVIRHYAPDQKELASFGNIGTEGKRVVYTIARFMKHEPIDYIQVPRQEGGHHVYDATHYIKQAQVIPETIGKTFRHIYIGDNTVMPIKIRAMGHDIANKLDIVRQFIRDGEDGAARAFVKKNLPMSWDEVSGWFKPTRHAETGTLHPPHLNLEEKIQVVEAGKSLNTPELKNKYESTWKDGTKSGNLASQYDVQFTGERDAKGLRTINNKGTATNPIYTWDAAPLLDPIPVMNRALNRMIQTTFMDDYKIMSAEHWLQEANKAGVLRPGESELRGAPFYHFMQPEYASGLDGALKARFEATNYQIRQFWGIQSKYQQALHGASQKLLDSIYGNFGDGRVMAVADWALPLAQDPLAVIRTMTFHAKLGFFAIPQLLVQSQTYANIYALAGVRHAVPGSAAATMQQWLRINKSPAFLEALDKKMSFFGWRPGEFKEAHLALERSGLANVQGEYAMLDNTLSANIIRSSIGEFMDAGTWFFKEGERNARYGAWYTAYHEFRNGGGGKLGFEGKLGRLTEADEKLILERADTLYGNMSRASSSALHQGVFSWTSQFLAYQIRLAEQMAGKRLTGWEKARMLGTNAALYGLPAATGLSGIPVFGDSIRNYALSNGYVVGENWYSSALMEGIPAMLGAYISGNGNVSDIKQRLRTGNWFNIGSRFGNSGFEWIKDLFRTDKTIWNIVGGAPGSFVTGTIANADPFMKTMLNAAKGSYDKFPAMGADLVDIFKQITTVNKTKQLIGALSTGYWASGNEAKLESVSPWKATFMAATGLQDQAIDDIFHKNDIKKSLDEMEKTAMTGYSREYRRFLQSLKDGDPEQANSYMTRARYYLQASMLPEQRKTRIMGRAMADRNNHDLISQVNWDFYINSMNVPEDKRQKYQAAFKEIQQQQNAKKQ